MTDELKLEKRFRRLRKECCPCNYVKQPNVVAKRMDTHVVNFSSADGGPNSVMR